MQKLLILFVIFQETTVIHRTITLKVIIISIFPQPLGNPHALCEYPAKAFQLQTSECNIFSEKLVPNFGMIAIQPNFYGDTKY